MYVTITNDFHNTEARVRPGVLSPATVRRVRRALCGMSDCCCGGVLSERGPQEAAIAHHYDRRGDDVVTVADPSALSRGGA